MPLAWRRDGCHSQYPAIPAGRRCQTMPKRMRKLRRHRARSTSSSAAVRARGNDAGAAQALFQRQESDAKLELRSPAARSCQRQGGNREGSARRSAERGRLLGPRDNRSRSLFARQRTWSERQKPKTRAIGCEKREAPCDSGPIFVGVRRDRPKTPRPPTDGLLAGCCRTSTMRAVRL